MSAHTHDLLLRNHHGRDLGDVVRKCRSLGDVLRNSKGRGLSHAASRHVSKY